MTVEDILQQALRLKPEDRIILIERLIASLDPPDKTLDAVWAEEAERRLMAHREGRLEGVPMEAVFDDLS